MGKEVVKKEENLPVDKEMLSDWDVAAPQLTSNDITVPRILLMQAMSEMVGEGEASIGDFVDSLTKEKLGSSKEPLSFVPFYLKKNWVEYNVLADGKKKFSKIYPITADNENLTYEDTITDDKGAKQKVSRDRLMDFYAILPSQVEVGGIPYIVSFRRSSLKAGKKLAAQMYMKNKAAGLYPPSVIMELSNSNFKGEKGNYNILDVRPLKQTPSEMIKHAHYWLKMVTSGAVKEDNSGLEDVEMSGEAVDVTETSNSKF